MKEQGIVALFDNPDQLKSSATQLREAHFQDMDAFTPYPVHGIDKAIGIPRSWVSAITLVCGFAGLIIGLFLTIWTSAVDWPLNVGGKPMVSLPAFVPIIFECVILCGGVMTVLGVLGLCGVPNFRAKPVDPRCTDDAYALWVPTRDDMQRAEVEQIAKAGGAYETRVVGAS